MAYRWCDIPFGALHQKKDENTVHQHREKQHRGVTPKRQPEMHGPLSFETIKPGKPRGQVLEKIIGFHENQFGPAVGFPDKHPVAD